jgi:hypothetical protein
MTNIIPPMGGQSLVEKQGRRDPQLVQKTVGPERFKPITTATCVPGKLLRLISVVAAVDSRPSA